MHCYMSAVDESKQYLKLVGVKEHFQAKEDKYYKIGKFCSTVGDILAFLPVGAIISKNLFPDTKPGDVEAIDAISLYSAYAAFSMLIVGFIFSMIMLYYYNQINKINKKLNELS